MTRDRGASVSVVIPAYNFGAFLPETIRSVREQTHPDVEIVVVDDGSTDETPEVLKRVEGPDLRWRHTPNRGVSAARNLGIELAEGDYVAFLDADDLWLPEKLERQVRLLQDEPDIGFVFCDFVRFDKDGRYPVTQFDLIPGIGDLPTREAVGGDGRVLREDIFAELVSLRLCPIYPSTLMVRGDLARDIDFPEDIGLSQDLYYFLHLYQRSRGGLLTDPLVEIRRHDENLSGATIDKRLADIEVLRKFRKREATAEHRDVLDRQLARRLAGLGYEHFWHGRVLAAARAYFTCLAHPGQRANALAHLAALPTAPLLARWRDGP